MELWKTFLLLLPLLFSDVIVCIRLEVNGGLGEEPLGNRPEEKVTITRLSQEEFYNQFGEGHNWIAGESAFHEAFQRNAASLLEKSESTDKRNSTDIGFERSSDVVTVEETEDYRKLQQQTQNYIDRYESVKQLAEEKHKKESKDNFLNSLVPSSDLGLCVYFDAQIAPLVSAGIGIQGTLTRSWKNKCFSASLALDVAIMIGTQFLGMYLRIAFGVSGSMSMSENPPSTLINMDKEGLYYVPDGVDLDRCHSATPWPMLMTFVETQIKEFRQSQDYKAQVAEAKAKHIDLVNKFNAEYSWLLSGPPYGNVDMRSSFVAPRIIWNAMTLDSQREYLLRAVSAYASSILERMLDDNKISLSDSTSRWTSSGKVYSENKGRFLARWPGKIGSRNTRSMKVMNFAKAVRSSNNTDHRYWKEFGISLTNLAIRFLEDVKSLFTLAYGGTAKWDGSCEALAVAVHTKDIAERATLYPWGSQHESRKGRANFLPPVKEGTFHPHLWCRLAALEFTDSGVEEKTKHQMNSDGIHERFALQACTTIEYQYLDVTGQQTMRWSETEKAYQVVVEDSIIGLLWAKQTNWMGPISPNSIMRQKPEDQRSVAGVWEITAEVDDVQTKMYAIADQIFVAQKTVSTRGECETIQFPPAVMATLPTFVKEVDNIIKQFEIDLLQINMCLGETHNEESLVKTIPEKELDDVLNAHHCDDGNVDAKYRFTHRKGMEMVRTFREMLADFGATPPTLSPLNENSEFELGSQLHLFGQKAKYIDMLEQDLVENLGIGHEYNPSEQLVLGERVNVHGHEATVEKNERTGVSFVKDGHIGTKKTNVNNAKKNQGEIVTLTGKLWRKLPSLSAEFNKGSLTLSRAPHKNIFLRPPVSFSATLMFYFNTVHNNFCYPEGGIVAVRGMVSRSWNSWSDEVSVEKCLGGRTRPGSFWVDLYKCWGKGYTDWRIHYTAMLFALWDTYSLSDPAGFGLWGNFYKPTLDTAIISLGSSAIGTAAGTLLHKYINRIEQHSIMRDLLTLGAVNTGLASMMAASAAWHQVAGGALKDLAVHGIFRDKMPKWAPEDPYPCTAVLITGSTTHRSKAVTVENAKALTPSLQKLVKDNTLNKISKSYSYNLCFWNILPVPKVALVDGLPHHIMGSLGITINWDMTSWIEALANFRANTERTQRAKKCEYCLKNQQGWCDMKYALGSLWNETEHDVCVPDMDESKTACDTSTGLVDGSGKMLRGQYYSMGTGDGLDECARIPLQLSNTEIQYDENVDRWTYKHT